MFGMYFLCATSYCNRQSETLTQIFRQKTNYFFRNIKEGLCSFYNGEEETNYFELNQKAAQWYGLQRNIFLMKNGYSHINVPECHIWLLIFVMEDTKMVIIIIFCLYVSIRCASGDNLPLGLINRLKRQICCKKPEVKKMWQVAAGRNKPSCVMYSFVLWM